MFNSKSTLPIKLALWGFIIGTTGILIDLSLDVGKEFPVVRLSACWLVFAKVLGYLCKVIGLLMVLITAVVKSDD